MWNRAPISGRAFLRTACCTGKRRKSSEDDTASLQGFEVSSHGTPYGSRFWENPHITEVHRLSAHTPLRALENEERGRNARIEEGHMDSKYFRLLTPPGTRWKFHFSETANRDAVPHVGAQGFPGAERWGDIDVPRSWETAGHGQAIYTNFVYPFKCDPPHIPADINHVGSYQTEISIPGEWRGRRVFLQFEGVSAAFYVWLDGNFVGYSQDSFLPAEFELTSKLHSTSNTTSLAPSKHVLSIRVLRYCDGSYMESQDMWWLSGIQRDVVLYSKPHELFIWDYKVTTDVDRSLTASLLTLEVELGGSGSLPPDAQLTASLYGPHKLLPGQQSALPPPNCPVVLDRVELPIPNQPPAGPARTPDTPTCVARLERRVACTPWSEDCPWLYTLVLALRRGAQAVDVEACRVGMRSVRVEGGQLKVNGRAIEIRGVNRHEHDARLGKYASRDTMLTDIRLMKQLNFNAVRLSHYPNRNLWYDLCDAYGLWVCDEANNETHGLVAYKNEEYLAEHQSWTKAYVERMMNMVLRDRNHACVITWSLGNESSHGMNIEAMADWARANDPTRPLQYESCGGAACTDIICPMYPSVEKLIALSSLSEQNKKSIELGRRWPAGTATGVRPVIPCEYAHAMNNSLGNLDEYWAAIRSPDYPSLQGGYIWDWVDQGLLKEVGGKEMWVYGGYCGEEIHDAQWNINGLLWPDRSPHPTVYQAKKSMQPVAIEVAWPGLEARASLNSLSHTRLDADILLRNLHAFRSLAGMGWCWRVDVDGECVAGSTGGQPQPLSLPAGQSLRLKASFALAVGALSGGKEAVLTVSVVLMAPEPWAPAGHELAWAQTLLPREPAHTPSPVSPLTSPGASPRTELLGVHVVGVGGQGELDGGGPALEVREGQGQTITVEARGGQGLKVTFCKRKGGLVGWRWEGVELLGMEGRGEAVVQSFWRAQTDNDNGGPDTLARYGATEQEYSVASGFASTTKRVRGAMKFGLWWLGLWGDTSYGRQWEHAGLDRLRPTQVRVVVAHKSMQTVVVKASYILKADGCSTAIPCVTSYQVLANGTIVVTNDCTLSPHLPPVARVGIQLSVPGKLRRLRWFGRGPHESYPDRKTGAKIGKYECDVDETYVPYICPQDNGNKSDVRWAALWGEDGKGVLVQAGREETVHLSAHRFTPHDLNRCRHAVELKEREEVTVTVDHKHMPCGGNNSWSRAHMPKYLIPPGSYTYSLSLSPLSSPAAAHRPPRWYAPASEYRAPSAWAARSAKLRKGFKAGMAAAPIKIAELIVELISAKGAGEIMPQEESWEADKTNLGRAWQGSCKCLGLLLLVLGLIAAAIVIGVVLKPDR